MNYQSIHSFAKISSDCAHLLLLQIHELHSLLLADSFPSDYISEPLRDCAWCMVTDPLNTGVLCVSFKDSLHLIVAFSVSLDVLHVGLEYLDISLLFVLIKAANG